METTVNYTEHDYGAFVLLEKKGFCTAIVDVMGTKEEVRDKLKTLLLNDIKEKGKLEI